MFRLLQIFELSNYKKNISYVIFPKHCTQIDIHLISYVKVKQVGRGHI